MLRKARRVDVLEPAVSLVGNVWLVDASDTRCAALARPYAAGDGRPPAGWSIEDGDGRVLPTGYASRPEAMRAMGALAVRGATLPLVLHRPDGDPTGDRLG